MADALQDLSTAANAVSGMVGSISALMTARINSEAALKASEIASAQASFRKRFKLPFGDPNRLTTENYREELERFDTSIKDSIGAIENKQVRGAVSTRFDAINSQFSLDISTEQYGMYVEETQYDRLKTYQTIKSSKIDEGQKVEQLKILMADDRSLGIWKPQDFDKYYAAFVTDSEANIVVDTLRKRDGYDRKAELSLSDIKDPELRAAAAAKMSAQMAAEDKRMFDPTDGVMKQLEMQREAGTLTIDQLAQERESFNGTADAANRFDAFVDKVAGTMGSEQLYTIFTNEIESKLVSGALTPTDALKLKASLVQRAEDMGARGYTEAEKMLGTLEREIDGFIDPSSVRTSEQEARLEVARLRHDWAVNKGAGSVKAINDLLAKITGVGQKYGYAQAYDLVTEILNDKSTPEQVRTTGRALLTLESDVVFQGMAKALAANPDQDFAKNISDVLSGMGKPFVDKKTGKIDMGALKTNARANAIMSSVLSSVNSQLNSGKIRPDQAEAAIMEGVATLAMFDNYMTPAKDGTLRGATSRLARAFQYIIDEGRVDTVATIGANGARENPMQIKEHLVDALKTPFVEGLKDIVGTVDPNSLNIDPITLDLSYKGKDGTIYNLDASSDGSRFEISAQRKGGNPVNVAVIDDYRFRAAIEKAAEAVFKGVGIAGKAVAENVITPIAKDINKNAEANAAAAKAAEEKKRYTQDEWNTLMTNGPKDWNGKPWSKMSEGAKRAVLLTGGRLPPSQP